MIEAPQKVCSLKRYSQEGFNILGLGEEESGGASARRRRRRRCRTPSQKRAAPEARGSNKEDATLFGMRLFTPPPRAWSAFALSYFIITSRICICVLRAPERRARARKGAQTRKC